MAGKISALSKATRKSVGETKPRREVIVACDQPDLKSDSGELLFSESQIKEALEGVCEGKTLEEQGKALKELHEPVVKEFALWNYARLWAATGVQPENPKLYAEADGTGACVQAIFWDKSMKLNDAQFAELESVIGATNAESVVDKYDEISFNQDKLNIMVKVGADQKSVLELVDEAISEKFAKLNRTDLLDGLFQTKEVFQTKKGVLPRMLSLVGGNAAKDCIAKVIDALKASRTIVGFKATASAAK